MLIRAGRAFSRFAGRACVSLATMAAFAQGDAIPASLQGYALVRVDAALELAIVRDAGGAYQSWRAGQVVAGDIKVSRLFADRIEVQATPAGRSQPQRYWLTVGMPGVVELETYKPPVHSAIPSSTRSAP